MIKKILIPVVILFCLAVIGLGSWKLFEIKLLSPVSFPANTSINEIDCSNMTMTRAQEKLTATWNKKTLSVSIDGKQIESFSDFGFAYSLDDSLRNAQREHLLKTALNRFFGVPLDLTIPMKVSKVDDSFRKKLEDSKALPPDKIIQTEDAYIDLSTDEFKIIPEVYGTNLDYVALAQDMAKVMETDTMDFAFVREDYYMQPKLTSDSPEIKERRAYCKKYLMEKVTYLLGEKKKPVRPIEIEKMLKVEFAKKEGEETKITAKKKAVHKYVEKLAKKYNTLGKTRKFKSLSGNNVTVSGGDYGYFLNIEGETRQLIKDLESDKKIEREPVWAQKGWGAYGKKHDLGDTYVEISLGGQHLWYFKKGKRLMDCPIVTGCVVERNTTPPGTFALSYKQRGATLRGFNNDGTKYESPVSYWMPFNGGIGMHDAPWRGAFGGGIYYSNGSHGCVNMPTGSAATLFQHIEAGTPVVVH